MTDRLAKGRSEGGGNLRKIPLIPERALAIHWRHQVDLRTKIKMSLEIATKRRYNNTTLAKIIIYASTCSISPGTAALPSAMKDFNCVKIESQCLSNEVTSVNGKLAIGFVKHANST
jgi:hypothetical protein